MQDVDTAARRCYRAFPDSILQISRKEMIVTLVRLGARRVELLVRTCSSRRLVTRWSLDSLTEVLIKSGRAARIVAAFQLVLLGWAVGIAVGL